MARPKQIGPHSGNFKNMKPKVATLSKESLGKPLKRPLPADSDEDQFAIIGSNPDKRGKFSARQIETDSDDFEVADDGSEHNENESDIDDDEDENDSEHDRNEDCSEDDDNEDDIDAEADEDDQSSDSDGTDDRGDPIEQANEVTAAIEAPNVETGESTTMGKRTPTESDYLLVPNATMDLAVLKTALLDRGYSVDDLVQLKFPVAMVTMPRDDVRKLSTDQPLRIRQNNVHFVHLSGSREALLSLRSEKPTDTLFVSGIPKFVTMEQMQAQLKCDKPIYLKLLDKGSKSRESNAALLTFSSKQAAATAKDALENLKFGGRSLGIAYSEGPSQRGQRLRGLTKTLLARCLPPGVTEDRLRAVFSTAANFKLITKESETICFITFSTALHATEAFDAHHATVIAKTPIDLLFVEDRKDTNFCIEVTNVPMNTSVSQVLSMFPDAMNASKGRRGNMSIYFPSMEVLRKSVQGVKKVGNKEIEMRVAGGFGQNVMHVGNVPFSAKESELRSLFPEAVNVELISGNDGRPRGLATITFPTSIEYTAAMKGRYKLANRTLFLAPKYVVIKRDGKQPNPISTNRNKANVDKPKSVLPQVESASEPSSSNDEDDSHVQGQPRTFKAPKVSDINDESGEDDTDQTEDDDDDDGSEEDVSDDDAENGSHGNDESPDDSESDEDDVSDHTVEDVRNDLTERGMAKTAHSEKITSVSNNLLEASRKEINRGTRGDFKRGGRNAFQGNRNRGFKRGGDTRGSKMHGSGRGVKHFSRDAGFQGSVDKTKSKFIGDGGFKRGAGHRGAGTGFQRGGLKHRGRGGNAVRGHKRY